MKYDLTAKWLYANDAGPLSNRFATLLRSKFFRGCVLKPKSLRVMPTAENVRNLIAPMQGLPPYSFDWTGANRQKPLQATATNCPPTDSRIPSLVLVRFSLGKSFTDGPFADASGLRDLALACAKVGPCPITCVEPKETDHAARLEIIRATDSWAVPVAIEWITVLHQSVVEKMAVDLMAVESVPGVRAGRKGVFSWIILTSHPFQGRSAEDLGIQRKVADVIDLPAIHSRFPRKR